MKLPKNYTVTADGKIKKTDHGKTLNQKYAAKNKRKWKAKS